MDWLAELHAEGRTILLVTHDMTLAAEYADRVVVLEGQIIASAPPASCSGSRTPVPGFAGCTAGAGPGPGTRARGLPGDSLTVESFCDEYVALVEERAQRGRVRLRQPMSQRFDLYLPRDSWLHRLDPRTKLWMVLLAGIVGLIYKQIAVLACLLILAHLVLLSARIPLSRIRWLWRRLAPLLVMILILQPSLLPVQGRTCSAWGRCG